MQFHYKTYGHAQAKNPCPRGYGIYNFGIPFLGHRYNTLILYGACTGIEKKYLNFTLLTPKSPLLGVGGHEIYNFLSSYPTDITYQIWLSSSWEEYANARQTMDDGRQPIAIGHLIDSGDLKSKMAEESNIITP